MKYIASCFMCFLLCTTTGQTQNLVPNGSFEDGDCPTTLAAINDLDHWYFGIQLPDVEWNFWPSPDWYHICSPFEELQPPNVLFGYQEPLSGGGMSGVLTYIDNTPSYLEILSVELSEPLEVGAAYTFSMAAVRAVSQAIGGSSNRLGMKLTTFPYWTTVEGPLTNSAHFSMDEVLEDSTNWNTFTQEIIADSVYKYLHIGNFYTDSATTAITYEYVVNFQPYYFLDEISLVKEPLSSARLEYHRGSLEAFPNPADQHTRIACKQGLSKIQVFGLNGQTIFEKYLYSTEQYQLNTSTWSSGVYFLKATDGEGAIHHLKLIKN